MKKKHRRAVEAVNTNSLSQKPIKGLNGYYFRSDGAVIGRLGREIYPNEDGMYAFRKGNNTVYLRHIDVIKYAVCADIDLFSVTPREVIRKTKSKRGKLQQIDDLIGFWSVQYAAIVSGDTSILQRHLFERYHKRLKRYFKYGYRTLDDETIDGLITDGCIDLTDKMINKGYTCFAPFCYLLTIIGQLCNKEVKQQKSKTTLNENTYYDYY